MVGRSATGGTPRWEQADSAGGPGGRQTWTSAFTTNRYASLDSALDAALARQDRAGELTAEIEALTADIAARRRRISAKRRALADASLAAGDAVVDVLQLLGRVGGRVAPPQRWARRNEQRAARLAAEEEGLATQLQRLTIAQEDLAELGSVGDDVREAVREKSERILSDRAEGWEKVRDLTSVFDRASGRSEQLRRAHEALQQVVQTAATALTRYEAMRWELALHLEEAPNRLEEATDEATTATEQMLASAESARFAVRHLELHRRVRLRVGRRLRMRRIPGPFVAPTTDQIRRLIQETRSLSRRAEQARSTVLAAATVAARDLHAAEVELTAVMKRPF